MKLIFIRAAFMVCLLTTQWANAQSGAKTVGAVADNPPANNLAILAKLPPVIFSADKQPGGFSIEEIEKVCPALLKKEVKLVATGKNSFKRVTVKSVDMHQLVRLLLGAVQELQQQVHPGYSRVTPVISP